MSVSLKYSSKCQVVWYGVSLNSRLHSYLIPVFWVTTPFVFRLRRPPSAPFHFREQDRVQQGGALFDSFQWGMLSRSGDLVHWNIAKWLGEKCKTKFHPYYSNVCCVMLRHDTAYYVQVVLNKDAGGSDQFLIFVIIY